MHLAVHAPCCLHDVLSLFEDNAGSNRLVLWPAPVAVRRDFRYTCAPAEACSFAAVAFLASCAATFSCLKYFSLAAAMVCSHVVLVGTALAIATGDVVIATVL